MVQAVDELLNINITKAALKPETGFTSSVEGATTAGGLSFVGWSLIVTAIVALIVATILFLIRRRFKRPRVALASSISAFTCGFIMLAFVAIPSVLGDMGHITNFNITTNVSTPVASTYTENLTLAEAAPHGYVVTAYVDNVSGGQLTNSQGDVIAPTSVITSNPDDLSMDSYGVKDFTTGKFVPISTDASEPTVIATTTQSAAAGTSVPITYAVKLDSTRPIDTYSGVIHYNISPPPFEGITTMQEMTHAICDTATIGDTGRLTDIRDGKSYYLTKLADGKCWMTQNLDLDLSASTPLTPDDTNLGTSWTPPTTLTDASSWANSKTTPVSLDIGEEYIVSSGTTSEDTPYTTLASCTATGRTADECAHYFTGNYYNWQAAVAGTTGSASICPKGWRLPSANSVAPSEFGTMLYEQGIINSASPTDISHAYTTNGFNNIRTAPLYWTRAGNIEESATKQRSAVGKQAYYWSNTSVGTDISYGMSFGASAINPRNNAPAFSRHEGFPVRCLAD